MPRHSLGEGFRLSLLQAAAFAGLGVYLPFFPLWLENQALTAAQIGVILAVPMVTRIVAVAPLMAYADGSLGPRRLLIGASLAAATIYAVLSFASGPLAIGLLVFMLALAQAPIIPTSDLIALGAMKRNPRLDYGRLRLWGSVAFLAANLSGGYLFGVAVPDAILWSLCGLALLAALAALLAVPPRTANKVGPTRHLSAQTEAGPPFGFWLLVGAAACVQASHAAVYGFGSLHWREIGFTNAAVGFLWGLGVAAEILAFLALGRSVGSAAAALPLVMVGGLAAAARFAAMALTASFAASCVLQLLHGASFGLTHLGTMAAVAHLVPSASRGRAQGIVSAAMALAMAAATVMSGALFRSAGPLVFATMVPLAALGFALAWLAARVLDAQPQRAGEGG